MDVNELFIHASRNKYRFNFKGQITVEELWDLKLKDLNNIFQTLNHELKNTAEESLLDEITPQNTELKNKIAIIRYIVRIKKEEAAQRVTAKANAEQKEHIRELITAKKNEEMSNKSIEELEAIYNSL